jgi:hypothetical protein
MLSNHIVVSLIFLSCKSTVDYRRRAHVYSSSLVPNSTLQRSQSRFIYHNQDCHDVVIKDCHDLFLFTQLTLPTLVILDQLYDYC